MKRLGLLMAAAAFLPATVSAQTLQEDATAFGFRTSISSIDLSPDGKKVAYIEPAAGGSAIAYVADIEKGSTQAFLKSGTAEKLRSCFFVSNVRLVCRYGGVVKRPDGLLVGFSRLMAINSDGSAKIDIGQRGSWHDERLRQFDGRIVDWLPNEDNAVLMAREYIPEAGKVGTRIVRTADGMGLDRIDTLTLASKPVERPRRGADGYMTDGRGNVRLVYYHERDSSRVLTGRLKVDYRPLNSGEWKTLSDFSSERTLPVAIDGATNSLYVVKNLDGRQALYRVRLTESPHPELVASHPRADIDGVVRSLNGDRIVGYWFVDDKRELVYFDPEYRTLRASLAKALPNLPLIDFVDSSADGTKTLVFAHSANEPGRYYLFDANAKRLNELFLARPQLENRKLAPVKPVMVRAADGTDVPASLTLPAGRDPKKLPAVVLPHGGPDARDEWGFDWLAQFLAARGYAVIQPNFRGSAGFNDRWLKDNGFKSWRTSVGDITGSIKWLVSEGIADPGRLAVVGWSYGAYAALQATATEPNLFKAVAAVAPVTDLQLMKTEAQYYSNADLVAAKVGSGPHIQDGSPLRLASSIKVPVVLVHGDLDNIAGVNHSLRMESALRSNGTPVELLRYDSLDHDLDDSGARREMLLKIGQLLERTIGR